MSVEIERCWTSRPTGHSCDFTISAERPGSSAFGQWPNVDNAEDSPDEYWSKLNLFFKKWGRKLVVFDRKWEEIEIF